MNYKIRNIELSDIDNVCKFTDVWIGENYYTKEKLRTILLQGIKDDLNASFLALDKDDNIVAVRITLAPGTWSNDEQIQFKISPHMWRVPEQTVGYFKSLFVHEDHQQKGLGRDLTLRSMEVLHNMGAMATLCHSWVESPKDSSRKYLSSLGFESVVQHENFWYFIDYECTRCGPKNCECTAEEMIYYFPVEEEE